MRKKHLLAYILLISLGLFVVNSAIVKIFAAGLTDITITPNADTQSTATDIEITFTPNNPLTNATILTVSYDTLFTDGADLVDTDIAISGTNITGKSCSGFITGYFTCAITTSGSVTTLVTVVIGDANQLTTPAAAGNYPVSVTADVGGLGTTIDSGTGLAYISDNSIKENEVLITAFVPSNLSLEIFQPSTNTKLSDPNTCSLGTLSISTVKNCLYDVGVGTNNASGASVVITSDGKLNNGIVDFTDTSGTITAGTEAYGFYISTDGIRFTPSGSYGSAYQAVPQTDSAFAASSQTSDLLDTSHHLTVTHAASVSSLTQVGNYTQTIIYKAYTN